MHIRRGTGEFSVFGHCTVLYCHVSVCLYGNCMCLLSDRYFGFGGCHGGRFLVAGLCFTVTLYRRLSLLFALLLSEISCLDFSSFE